MQELLEQVLELSLEDQLAIAVALQFMELTNTFRMQRGVPEISSSAAFGALHGMSASYVRTSQMAHDVMEEIRLAEIDGCDAIDLAFQILQNVRLLGYEQKDDLEDLSDMSLEQLFAEADRVGSRY